VLYEARGRFQIVTPRTIALPASTLQLLKFWQLGEVRRQAARLRDRIASVFLLLLLFGKHHDDLFPL
jgi:hypothetical protein